MKQFTEVKCTENMFWPINVYHSRAFSEIKLTIMEGDLEFMEGAFEIRLLATKGYLELPNKIDGWKKMISDLINLSHRESIFLCVNRCIKQMI